MDEAVRHGMRRLAVCATTAGLLLGALSIGGQPALAAGGFALETSFGGAGSALGQLKDPGALAVQAGTGDVFVVDTENARVEKFAPTHDTGGYEAVGEIRSLGSAFVFKSGPGVAVDNSSGPSAGDVYIVSGRSRKETVYQFRPKSAHADEYEATGVRLEGFVEGEEDENVHGLAVGADGSVYVAYGKSLSVFSPAGALEAKSPPLAAAEVQGLTVAGNELYVVTATGLEGWTLDAAHAVQSTTTISAAPAGSTYTAVAVGANDRVFVDVVYPKEEGASHVAAFVADAPANSVPIEEFGGNGHIQISHGLAYGVPGNVPSVFASDATDDEVHVFEYTVPAVSGCSATPTIDSAQVACLLAPDAPQATWTLEYRPQLGSFIEALGGTASGEGEVGGELTGLEPAELYTYRLEANNASSTASAEGQFETEPVAPLLTATGAEHVVASTATLDGTVNSEHSSVFYRFEYGRCVGEGGCAASPYPYEGPQAKAGLGREQEAVKDTVRELEPLASYHYRLVAIGPGGEAASGEQSFTTGTLPAAEATTGPASAVSQTGARISGTVNPNGRPTTFVWEVGTSSAYGSSVYGSAGGEAEPESVGLALAALLPGTTYHYRLLAVNAGGTSYGADETFTTLSYGAGAPLSAPPAPALLAVLPQEGTPPTPEVVVLPSAERKESAAQLLAKALKSCRKKHADGKRAACERAARKKYSQKR